MADGSGVGMIDLVTNMSLTYSNWTTLVPIAAGAPEWRLRLDWNWPLWATGLFFVATIAWVVAIYFREQSTVGKWGRGLLVGLRLVALALLCWMIAQPTVEWFRTGRPRLVLLLDRSASMATRDAPESTAPTKQKIDDISRIEMWQKLLAGAGSGMVDQLNTRYELEILTVDETIAPLEQNQASVVESLQAVKVAGALAGGTRLGDAIDYATRQLPGERPAAVVLFADGISNRGLSLQKAAERSAASRVPLYTIALGSDRPRPDVAVEAVAVEEVVFPGDRLVVEATIRATGFEGQMVEVILRDTARDQSVAITAIRLPADGTSKRVRLAIRLTEPGNHSLEVSTGPLPGEALTANNVARRVVEVRDETIQVLLVQSSPSYEFRAIKSLLERDPAIDLKVRLQEADEGFAQIDQHALRNFPHSEKELFRYDVILFGDVDPGLLPRRVWPLLLRFVAEHGGGMAMTAGPRFFPNSYRDIREMLTLLPIDLRDLPNPLRSRGTTNDAYSIRPTKLGLRTPSLQLGESQAASELIWQNLPPVYWLLGIDQLKPGAQVLAELPERTNSMGHKLPVFVRHYVGAGEVLMHATDETWRWRWRSDDRYFARYWGQVVRRLARGRLTAGRTTVELTTDRKSYEPGEQVVLRARLRAASSPTADDSTVIVHLQSTNQPRREIRLRRRLGFRGLYETELIDLPPGEYDARLGALAAGEQRGSVHFEVRDPPHELAQITTDRQAMAQIAELTGGKSYTAATATQLLSDLPRVKRVVLESLPSEPLWNHPIVLSLFVLALVSEWLLRRRFGML